MYTTTDDYAELVYTGQLTLKPGDNATLPGEPRWVLASTAGLGTTPQTVRVKVRGVNGRELLAFNQTGNRGHAIYDGLATTAHIVVPDRMREAPMSINDMAPNPAYELWVCALRMGRGESPVDAEDAPAETD